MVKLSERTENAQVRSNHPSSAGSSVNVARHPKAPFNNVTSNALEADNIPDGVFSIHRSAQAANERLIAAILAAIQVCWNTATIRLHQYPVAVDENWPFRPRLLEGFARRPKSKRRTQFTAIAHRARPTRRIKPWSLKSERKSSKTGSTFSQITQNDRESYASFRYRSA
jgi:hypothetical protein